MRCRKRGLIHYLLGAFLLRPVSIDGSRRDSSNLAFCSASPHRHPSFRLGHQSSIQKPHHGLDFSTKASAKHDDELSSNNPDIQRLARRLANSEFQKIVVLVGAGASVSAGIPDFRSPGTGLYHRLQEYNLPFPEAIFDLDYFRSNPKPFTTLCRFIWPGQEGGPKPTLTHHFLKLLDEQGCLLRVYTQNIDGLEALAGIPDERLVECHGHFRSATCISCRTPMAAQECLEQVQLGETPTCGTCGSLVKPDIVFFGEELPMRFQQQVSKDVAECDLLLVIGTSLLVMPVAGIPSWVSPDCTRVLLNREVVGEFAHAKRSATGGTTGRDVVLQGDCDESVRVICELAGWSKYHMGDTKE